MVGVEALAVIIGYLLGSIPFAYIAGRLIKGVDIRQAGSGNVGAVNTMREIGTAAGFAVLIADIAKGTMAVLIAQWLGLSLILVFLDTRMLVFIVGFAAVVGHNWPVSLKFKGGKGAATTLGVLLALAPVELAISFAIMVIVVLVTSNMRLGIGIGLALLPLIIWGFGGTGSLIAYSLALPLFLGFRNIRAFKRELASVSDKKDLIIDKQFTPWQRRK